MDFIKEIHKLGLDEESYKSLLKDIDEKLSGEKKITWEELCLKYNLNCHPHTLKKASSTIFGGSFRSEYLKNQIYTYPEQFDKKTELDRKLDEIKKERIKLQTANIESNRLLRQQTRKEMFYEYIGNYCNSIELPDFKPLMVNEENNCEYLLTLADIHYGASFESENNIYSSEIAQKRLERLSGEVIDFVIKNKLSKISVLELGDSIQGILRVNDLRINDSSVVKATVEISKLIAMFLNSISEYCVVDYYHVPFANHTQMRSLGSKANELFDEDLEYVISHYIESLCENNERINVYLAKENDLYLDLKINGNDIIACHGHTIKNLNNLLKNLSIVREKMYDCCILGHFHGANSFVSHETISGDCEVIVAPSFIGSDPFSDSLFKGSKAASLILGFDYLNSHVETYKIVLN